MAKQDREYKSFTVTVSSQPNLDLVILKAVLAEIGLRGDFLINIFGNEFDHGNFINYCLALLHEGKESAVWYAGILRQAKTGGSVTATIQVPVDLILRIQAFINAAKPEAQKRLSDAGDQIAGGINEAAQGVSKNLLEAGNDMAKGGEKGMAGTWDLMTSPRFKQGAKDAAGGLTQFAKGFGKFHIQTPADAALMIGGRLISGWQVLSFIEAPGRPLTPAEKTLLEKIFQTSVEYDAIRIKQGYAGILNAGDDQGFTLYNNQRALTHGNTIYMKNKAEKTPDWDATLVHETTHVWQNQNGGTDYMWEALHAQMTAGYGYYDDVINKGKTWGMLNPEQQGQLIEDAYEAGYFTKNQGQWIEVDPLTKQVIGPRPDLATFMKGVEPQLRSGQGAT